MPWPPDAVTLDDLRQRVTDIDRQLIALVAERKAVSGEVARVKRATGYPTRDYEREREVILGVRTKASRARRVAGAGRGAPAPADPLLAHHPGAGERRRQGAGSGRRALVIGGAGKMGRWFVEFLASQGFSVEVADPAGGAPRAWRAWRTGAAPISSTTTSCSPRRSASPTRSCSELALRRPPGVIFDVGSLKSPLRAGLLALKSHGCKVTSDAPDVRAGYRAAVGPPRGVRGFGQRRGARSARASCSRRPWPSRW